MQGGSLARGCGEAAWGLAFVRRALAVFWLGEACSRVGAQRDNGQPPYVLVRRGAQLRPELGREDAAAFEYGDFGGRWSPGASALPVDGKTTRKASIVCLVSHRYEF